FVMMLPAVAMSVFLAYSLLSRNLQCRICWTGHVASGVLALLFPAQASQLTSTLYAQAADPDALYKDRETIAKAQQAEQIWADRLAEGTKDSVCVVKAS